MRQMVNAGALVVGSLLLCGAIGISPAAAQTAEGAPMDAPAGAYRLDKAHASLIFRLSHMGFSNYTARFKRFDAELQFDPANPAKMTVTATIDPTSIETDFPQPEKFDFNAELKGAKWLNAAKFPQITYRSMGITLTGANRAEVAGELELHGVKQPVTLEITFNGGYRGMSLDPNARIGFSARGTLKRSLFGIVYGIPAPGSNMGVSDAVEVQIEAEFNGPALTEGKPGN
jgi:polyisoprenoid-binding protein YceI